MADFCLTNESIKNVYVPPFSITLENTAVTALYCDVDMQTELIHGLRLARKVSIFNWQDGLYERLTVESNIRFYHKWFGSTYSLPEILVLFHLHSCANIPLHKCSRSEIRRVYYAKYFLSSTEAPLIFIEPVHGVDVVTVDVFITMLAKLQEKNATVLVLAANLEHALLLGEKAYKLNNQGMHTIEMETNEKETPSTESAPTIVNLYKVPAKVKDKVILFDPTEIDYIESQEGRAQLVINDESFTLDSTLAEIEKKLEVYGFFRCHRSYIVNLQKVREIITWSKNTYSLKVDNQIESTIPLSRTKVQEIQQIFNLK